MIDLYEVFLSPQRIVYTCLIVFVAGFYVHVRRKHGFWARQGIIGPKPTFLFGTIFQGDIKQPICLQNDVHFRKYGLMVGLYNGLKPALLLSDPDILKNICVSGFHTFPEGFKSVYKHPVESEMITAIYGEKWKRIRSLLSPTFSTGKLKRMLPVMKFTLINAMDELNRLCEKEGSFDPKHFWSCYNIDLIAKCCFASQLNAFTDKDSTLLRNFIEFFKGNILKVLAIMTLPEWVSKLFKLGIFPAKNLEFFRDITLHIIENRKNQDQKFNDFLQILVDHKADELSSKEAERELNKIGVGANPELNSPDDTQKTPAKSSPLLSSQTKDTKLSSEEIVGACVTFLVAGYETTSTLLTWACYQLALNPDIQQRLYDEISSTDFTEYENLVTLPYLDAVLHEVLRINPPIVLFQRIAHQDYVIEKTNTKIIPGTLITIPVYSIHHNPDFYPDPKKFDPERFMPENKVNIRPFTFLPFGAGPRYCMGARFALLNAKISLCSLLSNYELFKIDKTPENLDYCVGAILLHPKDNFYVGIRRRM